MIKPLPPLRLPHAEVATSIAAQRSTTIASVQSASLQVSSRVTLSITQSQTAKGKANLPNLGRMLLHCWSRVLTTPETSLLVRLTRASGATAAAKAIAPQARTEKTVEKRILIEIKDGSVEKRGAVESWSRETGRERTPNRELGLRAPTRKPGQVFIR